MQLANSEFICDCKEGKAGYIFRQDHLFAIIYSGESAVKAITQFLNDNHKKRQEYIESEEQQAANRLHNDKIVNRRTGEEY